MTVQHKDIPNDGLHEPKGVSTASSGQVYLANGAGSGTWANSPTTGTLIGILDYNDLATATTPIVVTGGAGYVDLPNDGLGAFTNKLYPPAGVTDVWTAGTGLFDWSQLVLGDMVDIRLDVEVTTSGANQDFDIELELGTGGFAYSIPFERQLVKSAGAVPVNVYNGIYLGDSNTLDNGAKFKIKSDGNATVIVRGWYCKVLINR
jgi:hypothetical protein